MERRPKKNNNCEKQMKKMSQPIIGMINYEIWCFFIYSLPAKRNTSKYVAPEKRKEPTDLKGTIYQYEANNK